MRCWKLKLLRKYDLHLFISFVWCANQPKESETFKAECFSLATDALSGLTQPVNYCGLFVYFGEISAFYQSHKLVIGGNEKVWVATGENISAVFVSRQPEQRQWNMAAAVSEWWWHRRPRQETIGRVLADRKDGDSATCLPSRATLYLSFSSSRSNKVLICKCVDVLTPLPFPLPCRNGTKRDIFSIDLIYSF